MKRITKLVLTSGLILPACSIPTVVASCSINKAGSFGFMFKTTGNHYGELLYEGFSTYLDKPEVNIKHYDKSPSEANVGEQIQILETLILQNVKALTISAAGTTGYDNVLKKAHEKNIKVVSVDSPISPKYRLVHVDHCDPQMVGRWLAYAAILIALKKPYPYSLLKSDIPDIDKFGEYVAEQCNGYSGSKKKFGHLSSTSDSPSQNEWIKYTNQALKEDRFKNVVDSAEPEVKYGKDDPTTSKQQAEAFISSASIDVMICPTTVAMLSAGQAVKQHQSTKIKITGIGLPSEMKQFMPTAEDVKKGNEFSYPCPYMTVWNVKMFGELAAYVADKAVKGEYKGEVGETLPEYLGSDGVKYNLKTVATSETPKYDGTPATKIVSLEPLGICGENIEKFKDI